MNARIYLDHAASTPLDPAAREAMLEVLDVSGNPSSPHEEGRRAKEHLEHARSGIAHVLDCRPREVVFTASGTVASQIALLGAARARRSAHGRVVTSAVEHPAVSDAAEHLAAEGMVVSTVAPRPDGNVDADAFLEAIDDDVAIAALMLTNHETGIVQPVQEVGRVLRTQRIPLLCDACLGPGRVPTRPGDLHADLVAYSGHKLGGPRGAGVLYVRRKTKLERLWTGGLQEERLSPGTESVAAAAGMAAAFARSFDAVAERGERYAALIDRLLSALEPSRPWSPVGNAAHAPGVITLELPGVEGEAAMINLDLEGIAVSTGSACAHGATLTSPSLLAMGMSHQRAASTIRVSIGEGNDAQQIDMAAQVLNSVITRLRSLARR